MTNFAAKILNNSVSALSAQQAVIATTANNIANVNTEGYSRREVQLQTRVTRGSQGVLDVGNGVEVGRVRQITDTFLERLMRDASSDEGYSTVRNEFLDRLQRSFGLTDTDSTIGSTMTNFFGSLNALSADPSNLNLRTNVLARADDLVQSIQNTFSQIADLQTEADQRIASEIADVNSITERIAILNGLISSREAGSGSVAGDERDQRNVLLQQLSSKLNISTIDQADGSITISLPNGLALVNGSTSNDLYVTTSPSFGGATLPPSLDGRVLSYVVYDYSGGAGTAEVDLSQQITGGSIGGLLAIRGTTATSNTSPFQANGALVEAAARVESLSRYLLTTFNSNYVGNGTVRTGDLNGTTSQPFDFFTFTGATDVNTNGLADAADLAASGNGNFSSILTLGIRDPRRIAGSFDTSGGPPAAAVYASGDNRNIRALAGLQSTSVTFSSGSFSLSGTPQQLYSELVSKVGNDKARAQLDQTVAANSLKAALNRRDQVSGVSLDEEFTNLIKFQKAYQAAARMIKVGQDLLDQILQVL